MNISKLHADIEDSMERQREWDTNNFIGGTDGTDFRGMSEDGLTQYFVEQMGQGIKRRGGNY